MLEQFEIPPGVEVRVDQAVMRRTVESVFSVLVSGAYLSVSISPGQFVGYIFLDNNPTIIIYLARTVDHAETATTQRFFQPITVQAGAGF